MQDNPSQTAAEGAGAALPDASTPPQVQGVGGDLRHAGWLLARYLRADPWIGILLLTAQIAGGGVLTFFVLQIQIHLAAITNALAAMDGSSIPGHAVALLGIAAVSTGMGLLLLLTRFIFQIRFRRVITENLLGRWLSNNRFFDLDRRARIDHPEQRIQEDVQQFIALSVDLAPTILVSVFGIFLYTGQLWTLSPPVTVWGLGPIPGLLVFLAYGFALVFTFLTHWVGVGLTRAEVERQGIEARFRQEMGGIRENAESVAFSRGADVERERLTGTFEQIRRNWKAFTWSSMAVNFVSGWPSTILIIAPTLLAAPFVLKGTMQIGDVVLISASLAAVNAGVGVLIQYYSQLAIVRSTVARLRLLHELLSVTTTSDIKVADGEGREIEVRKLTIAYPDGSTMTDVGDLRIAPGDRLLVQGRSGAGKSTLLRSIAGLWPFGRGEVTLPRDARIAFLPQRGYMPDGTLASLMSYPRTPDAFPDETYADLLSHFGLERLVARLHDFEPWSRILSPGEQQRISAARAILTAPDFLFVDEATSALDTESEANLYALIAHRLPGAALISVAHRPAVERYHDTVLKLEDRKTRLTNLAAATR